MSEVVKNVSEESSAQSTEATAPSAETVEDIPTNNIDAAVKAVPEAVETVSSVKTDNNDDSRSKDAGEELSTSPKVENKKTPAKRTPSKRVSYIERAQKESEELVKNMGGSLEIEGGRRTRSSTRGTPTRSAAAATPPPTKKSRTSPASGASTPTRARGRGRKIDVSDDATEEEENKQMPSKKITPTKGKKAAAKEVVEDEEVKEIPEEEKEAEKKTEEKKENEDSTELKTTVENPEEDNTDAVLETVVEETQSQVAADSLPLMEKNVTKEPENKSSSTEVVIVELTESVKSDSPMDTEEAKPEESVKEQKENKHEVKEPTPEPMEIDSSPNTNDDVVEINEEMSEVGQMTTAGLATANVNELRNNIEKAEKIIIENSVASKAVAAPVANNSILKPAAVIDVAKANENNKQETTIANNDINKTENDLCEPKIATSPPISAANDNSSVTTPQTCN